MSEALLQIVWLAAIQHRRKNPAMKGEAHGASIARRVEWDWILDILEELRRQLGFYPALPMKMS